jgi:hypothetical protein
MFPHLCQQRPDSMPERVPAYASDANALERGTNLSLLSEFSRCESAGQMICAESIDRLPLLVVLAHGLRLPAQVRR